jgi:hypothetical protein
MKAWALAVVAIVLIAATASAQDVGFASAWPELTAAERDQVMKFGEEFKDFMGRAKSEMFFVREGTTYI